MESKKIAIVRIRGIIDINSGVENEFKRLRLFRKNGCVVIDGNRSYKGVLQKIKDYATWGEIDEETFKTLLLQRGRLPGNKPMTENYLKEKIKVDADTFVKEFSVIGLFPGNLPLCNNKVLKVSSSI